MGRTITQIIMIKKRLLLWEIRLTLREQFSSENGRMELKNKKHIFIEYKGDCNEQQGK